MADAPLQVHGTAVAIDGRGVLLRGVPGAGKSDLALRLIDGGARLIADDRVDVRVADGRVAISAPTTLAGLIEARGVGIVPVGAVASAPLALVVDLVAPDHVPRLPDPSTCEIAGIAIAHVRLAPFEASAPAKVRLALAVAAGTLEARI